MELIARLIEIRLYIHRQVSGLIFWMTECQTLSVISAGAATGVHDI